MWNISLVISLGEVSQNCSGTLRGPIRKFKGDSKATRQLSVTLAGAFVP